MSTREKKRRKNLRAWVITATYACGVLAAILIALSLALSAIARDRAVRLLEERFQSQVELGALRVWLFPWVRVTGKSLVFRQRGRTDVPPLIAIDEFSASPGLAGLLDSPRRIKSVRLNGLRICVPTGIHKLPPEPPKPQNQPLSFEVEEVIADGTRLEILPSLPGRAPLVFHLHRLTVTSAGRNRPMGFRATLTNPKPPGWIESTGEFGPWHDQPGLTPVSGVYRFENADLSAFRGISGKLFSQGSYRGVLGRIEVEGHTDTPEFAVQVSGHPIHLRTRFSAVVDGTNGDTVLDPVSARFMRSSLDARGGVVRQPDRQGKTVSLFVRTNGARVEDVLRFAVRSAQPIMTGAVEFSTKLEIPPGDKDIVDKLKLDGSFSLRSGRFTTGGVQQKIEMLSRRGRGEPDEEVSPDVVSDLKGRFSVQNAVVTFSDLSFRVPGALVQVRGAYQLRSQQMDFRGTLRLAATLSETTSGVKSYFLKLFDPFFKKDSAGTVLPITITGSREKPVFRAHIFGDK